MTNRLFYGDNLDVLRDQIADESVGLIYLDPPFNSDANYNVLFRAPAGKQSEAQIEAFQDTWHWGDSAARAFDDVLHSRHTNAATMLRAMRSFLGENDMMAYLAMMAARLIELHRVLKPTGSLYLHCDPTAGHYLKIVLDSVFGVECFRSQIVWKRSTAHSDGKQGRKIHGHIHDLVFFYSKSDNWTWNSIHTSYDDSYISSHYSLIEPDTKRRFRADNLTAAKPGGDTSYDWRIKRNQANGTNWQADLDDEYLCPKTGWIYEIAKPYKGRYWAYSTENMIRFEKENRIYYTSTGMPNFKRFLDEMPGVPLQDVWTDIPPINSQAAERLGYPTQKPLALLERIIQASSNEGDVVLDPFCGCGTAVHAAEKLKRNWIGIDITHLSISLIERRLKDAFADIKFDVLGTPKDFSGAQDLAQRDKYQFQWWAVSLVDAVPQGGKKKGMDRGIDGIRWVRTGPKGGDLEQVLVSVKGGDSVGPAMVRDLKGTVERENAAAGIFVTLAEPTREMKREAAASGLFETPFGRHQRIQILTIQELLAGIKPDLPAHGRGEGFRQAPRERGPRPQQGGLDV